MVHDSRLRRARLPPPPLLLSTAVRRDVGWEVVMGWGCGVGAGGEGRGDKMRDATRKGCRRKGFIRKGRTRGRHAERK